MKINGDRMTLNDASSVIILGLALCLSGCSGHNYDGAPISSTTYWSPPHDALRMPPGVYHHKTMVSSSEQFSDLSMPETDSSQMTSDDRDVSPTKIYNLADLINLAELMNPKTRVAWHAARAAAAAQGLADSKYMPHLTASVLAGGGTGVIPLAHMSGGGWYKITGAQILPVGTVNWLLFDFGGRQALQSMTREALYAANFGFNRMHQLVMFDVTRAYYSLNAATEGVKTAREAVGDAKVVVQAANARMRQGIATTVEVAQSEQTYAQMNFLLVSAVGRQRDAYAILRHAIGLSYDSELHVADESNRPIPERTSADISVYVKNALTSRPDVLAALSIERGAQEHVKSVASEFLPTFYLTGNVSGYSAWRQGSFHGGAKGLVQSLGMASSYGVNNTTEPVAGLMFGMSVPLYDGGMRQAQLAQARSDQKGAEAAFDELSQNVEQEVVLAYNALETSVSSYRSALTLERAASITYEAALGAYQQGVGTMQDLSTAMTGLQAARQRRSDSHSASLTAAAALSFATGSLVSEKN